MDEKYLKSIAQTIQTEYENDSFSSAVTTVQSVLGDIVLVRLDQSLDLTVFFTFQNAVETANANLRTELIVIDLDTTELYSESGAVMLRLLRQQLRAQLRDRIFLINANPEIKQRLELELPLAQFHIGMSMKTGSSVKLH